MQEKKQKQLPLNTDDDKMANINGEKCFLFLYTTGREYRRE